MGEHKMKCKYGFYTCAFIGQVDFCNKALICIYYRNVMYICIKKANNMPTLIRKSNEVTVMEAFYEAAYLDNTRMKFYSTKRTGGEIYADVMIADCQYDNWWYKDFIGETCFCLLILKDWGYGNFLYEAVVVNLTSTKILTGRSLDPKDVFIL